MDPATGVDVHGPFPADTIFLRAMKREFDVVVACCHDQGLIPMKLAAFGRAVNVTLRLPIVRTSVGHGTAFDIPRRGVADPSSLIEAVRRAARLAAERFRHPSTPAQGIPSNVEGEGGSHQLQSSHAIGSQG